jgi:hypothetical protein
MELASFSFKSSTNPVCILSEHTRLLKHRHLPEKSKQRLKNHKIIVCMMRGGAKITAAIRWR